MHAECNECRQKLSLSVIVIVLGEKHFKILVNEFILFSLGPSGSGVRFIFTNYLVMMEEKRNSEHRAKLSERRH